MVQNVRYYWIQEPANHLCPNHIIYSANLYIHYQNLFIKLKELGDALGEVLSQRQTDRQYHPIAYGRRALMLHEKNYHSTKLEFLTLKWAVTEHFKEYLPYQSFMVQTDNNLLMYIMAMPNLDCHWSLMGQCPCVV